MFSRKISDLSQEAQVMANKLIALSAEERFNILIYCTYRPISDQARLFRKGRSLKEITERADQLDKEFSRPDLANQLLNVGPQAGNTIVTWAAPGQSAHNFVEALALDGCPMLHGKPVWSPVDIEATPDVDEGALWAQYGDLVQRSGFSWAGNWKHKREFPHAQVPDFNWRDLIKTAKF